MGSVMTTRENSIELVTLLKPAEAGLVSHSLTVDVLKPDYRALFEVLVSERNLTTDSQYENKLQSLMRVIYSGQKQNLKPDILRKMIADTDALARQHKKLTSLPGVEKRAGMLAGSSSMRKIG
ncbi:hypothetical protein QU24_04535 [Pantoea rodasii]|uniref:Uncharacterized protein n=1 Tax=Pantoea rodasii TaxID=1076549 RepID=A0A0B1RDK6_9GAMM|nr:hypothetical protein [Pantoea rodasii]KHJ69307.1 hypothetical protein QU24_04535 [Pantoea rodasii]